LGSFLLLSQDLNDLYFEGADHLWLVLLEDHLLCPTVVAGLVLVLLQLLKENRSEGGQLCVSTPT